MPNLVQDLICNSYREYSVKEQDKLIEGAMRKALGPDTECQFHGAFVSSKLLKQGKCN